MKAFAWELLSTAQTGRGEKVRLCVKLLEAREGHCCNANEEDRCVWVVYGFSKRSNISISGEGMRTGLKKA